MLAREGVRDAAGEPASFGGGRPVWRFRTITPEGGTCEIRCTGPELPDAVPGTLVRPADVPQDPGWRWTYRLTVAMPLTTLDLCWRAEGPLRILAFSRGDWEARLLNIALVRPD